MKILQQEVRINRIITFVKNMFLVYRYGELG